MKDKFSSFSIILIFLCLTFLGFFFIPKLSFKLNPSRKQPEVNVQFKMQGQSPRIVEMEVTSKLEAVLSRVQGVKSLESSSEQNGGSIKIELSDNIDPQIARFEISTVIRQLWPSLPDGVTYPSVQMSGVSKDANRPFLQYTINAPLSPIEIQEYINDNIRNKIASVKGINSVNVYGAGEYAYKLEYDYQTLQSNQVTIEDIRTAINSYLNEEFLGMTDFSEGDTKGFIRIKLLPEKAQKNFDPSTIQITNKEGRIIYLNQLVKTSYQEEKPSSYYRINGMNSVFLSITPDEQSNRLQLSKEVQQLLDKLCLSLPAGYELHKSYDESEYLTKELNKIYLRSGLTVLIILIFVFVIYRNIKLSLLIILSLICNFSIASILYYLLRIEIHAFSLAGITISVTLVIDNFIIMSDQIIQRKNKKVFTAILTATLTTIGSLSIIFFLDDQIRLNLLDFAVVIVLNLVISLLVTFFFILALIDRLKLQKKVQPKVLGGFKRRKRVFVWFNRIYERIICFCCGRKAKTCIVILLVLAFGLPIFLLPDKLGEDNYFHEKKEKTEKNYWTKLYNQTLGSQFYKEKIKPITDIALGGSLRLFVQKVKEGSYSTEERGETTLYANASLPNGATKEQMNNLVKKMEKYISGYKEIKMFETSIQSGQRANIRILFKDQFQRGQFPYMLYSELISKTLELGGGSWSVYGVGDGFNNDVKEQAGSSRIKLLGYNYDELNKLAEGMRDSLLQHRRIKEVLIESEFSWYKNDYSEFGLNINKSKISETSLSPSDLYTGLTPIFQRDVSAGTWNVNGKDTPIKLCSKQANELDVWNLKHYPGKTGQTDFRLSSLASIEKSQAPQEISKENQQYRLCLQYEYIGNYTQADKIMNDQIEQFNASAPLGFKAESDSPRYWWDKGDKNQYWLLLVIFIIIFFTTSILFNSWKQPLIILSIIPITFIGVFLTFYLFDINFDQGGFAAFVLLSGLSINANIYMLDEYKRILKKQPFIPPIKAYLKAWNTKIIPIFLTILSTIIGFIPFMVGTLKEAFWFPLAAGTSGGLIMSLVSIFFFLPMFIEKPKKCNSL